MGPWDMNGLRWRPNHLPGFFRDGLPGTVMRPWWMAAALLMTLLAGCLGGESPPDAGRQATATSGGAEAAAPGDCEPHRAVLSARQAYDRAAPLAAEAGAPVLRVVLAMEDGPSWAPLPVQGEDVADGCDLDGLSPHWEVRFTASAEPLDGFHRLDTYSVQVWADGRSGGVWSRNTTWSSRAVDPAVWAVDSDAAAAAAWGNDTFRQALGTVPLPHPATYQLERRQDFGGTNEEEPPIWTVHADHVNDDERRSSCGATAVVLAPTGKVQVAFPTGDACPD